MEPIAVCDFWGSVNLRNMEKLTSQIIDSGKMQESVPEYLWFVIAIGGIIGISFILLRLVNYLISTIAELRTTNMENTKAIAVIQEVLSSLKDMVQDHEQDIRELQKSKRNRGQ